MSFLYPAFLFALAVLAIPLVVHLFHFRRYKTILFSNVSFLKAVDTERKNQNRLKHLLVLAMRCLAFICLVFAFAIPGCGTKKQVAGKKAVCIYIDNSFSMEQRNSSGILLETAKQKARDIVKSLGEKADYQVLGNDPLSNTTAFMNGTDAIKKIDELQTSSRSVSAGKIWRQMQDYLGAAPDEDRIGYIISDFQGSFLRDFPSKKPEHVINIQCLKLDGPEKGNVSIDSAWLENPFSMAGEKAIVGFKIHNYTPEKLSEVNVGLMINNSKRSLAKIAVDAYSEAKGSIEFTMPSENLAAASLEIDDPESTFDNKLYFSLQPQGDLNILFAGNNLYLKRAIETNGFFKIKDKTDKQNDAQAWYWADFKGATTSQISELADFVRKGGRAVINPGNGLSINDLGELNSVFGLPKIAGSKTGKFKIEKAGLNHRFFNQVFNKIPQNIEMPTITQYYNTGGSLGNGEGILMLDNGDPFLLQFKLGKGFLYFFTSTFDVSAGNFVQSSLFLPVVVNCALNNEQTGNIFGTTGSNKGYLLKSNFAPGDGNLTLSSEGKEFVPEVQNGNSGEELFIGSYLQKAGFYTLQDKKMAGSKELIALNCPRTESDPRPATSEKQKEFADKTGVEWLQSSNAIAAAQAAAIDSTKWRLFIWLAAAFFALEVLILTFWDSIVKKLNKTPLKPTT